MQKRRRPRRDRDSLIEDWIILGVLVLIIAAVIGGVIAAIFLIK